MPETAQDHQFKVTKKVQKAYETMPPRSSEASGEAGPAASLASFVSRD
jgi:hypothetical protein